MPTVPAGESRIGVPAVISYPYLVIGGGMTADAAVRGIRELDATGPIGLIGAEPVPPYARPPLSKGLWKGDPLEDIWRGTGQAGVEFHLGRRVTAIDLAARTVRDDRGTQYGYGKLLLATGGRPRRLPFGGDDVIYFRDLEDYRRLRAHVDRGASFAVVGGGFIGSEIAAALASQNRTVAMYFPEEGIGSRVFPADLARFLVGYFEDKGVEVLRGRKVSNVIARGSRSEVHADGESPREVDAVVAGLGIVPETELAAAAGLEVDDGILVDERLTTNDPRVFAAGDVARFPAPALGGRLRVEHEDNAVSMGRAAGRAMAGDDATYTHLPSFYSDLFDLGYEAVGELDPRGETVADWKVPFREGVVYYLKAGRVRGVLLWNTWGQVDAARALIAEPGPFHAADLAGRLPG